jgi:septal ring-binding cell division protein DamX
MLTLDHLESLLPDGVPPGSEIQASSVNSAAPTHVRTVRPVRQGTLALLQVVDRPTPSRGPSAPVQRAPPPVLNAVIGARIDVNRSFL